ncbi:MAG: type II toxin-antitoxin system RelE/ParE family toxin [Defluviitaleaceae bacterium]|nr:type II toxin-antitoxin system RelE/ParE family toxin [Defluviitaleaceae bacterium]
MRFKLTTDAKRYLDTLDKPTVNRIYEALRSMTREPSVGDTKPLSGSDTLYRLRVGDFRIIYEIDGNNVIIEKISPRGQAYKGL